MFRFDTAFLSEFWSLIIAYLQYPVERLIQSVTYLDIRNTPDVQLSSALVKADLRENSTIPDPVDLPLSSTTTTALSTCQVCE